MTMDWINVNDAVPEDDSEVLIYVNLPDVNKPEKKYVTLGRYNRRLIGGKPLWLESDREYGEVGTNIVSHWMPLPKPPEEV